MVVVGGGGRVRLVIGGAEGVSRGRGGRAVGYGGSAEME